MAYVSPQGPPRPQPRSDAGLPPHQYPPPPFPGGPPPHHFPPHHMHGLPPPPPPPHGHGPYGAPPPPHAGHGPPPPHHHMHFGPFGAPPHRPPTPPHGHVPPPGHGPPPPPFEAGFGPPHHPPPPGSPFHHEHPHHQPMPTTTGDNTGAYHLPPPHHAFAGDGGVPRPPPPHGGPMGVGMGGPPHMSMPRGPPRHAAPRIEAPHADPSSYPAKAFTRGLDGQSSPEVVGQDATTGGPKSMRARVELKQDEITLYVLSNGVPNYQPRSSSAEDLTTDWTRVGPARAGRLDFNPGAIIEQEHVFYIPLRPQDTGSSWKALYDVTAAGGGPPPRGPPGMMGRQQGPMWTPMGPIGVAINGVPLFNQYSAIMDDAVETESFDVCCGHPVPGIGAYHYHQFPKCVRGSRALGVNTTDDRLATDITTAITTTASTHPPQSSPSPFTPAGPSTIPTASAAPSTIPTASASAVPTSTEDIPVAQVVSSSNTTTEITMDPTPVPGVVVTLSALPPVTAVTTEKDGGGLLQASTAGGGGVSDNTPSTTTEAELMAEEAAVAAALLDLVAQGNGHSAIVGYAFDGYPIYGPVGWGPKGSAKVMRSSYQRRGEDHEFVEGSGDLDVCNGILGPTPEYPEGVYHYHCTVGAAALQEGRMVATYPYVIGRYRGVPDVRNFPPFLLDMPGASSAQQGQRR